MFTQNIADQIVAPAAPAANGQAANGRNPVDLTLGVGIPFSNLVVSPQPQELIVERQAVPTPKPVEPDALMNEITSERLVTPDPELPWAATGPDPRPNGDAQARVPNTPLAVSVPVADRLDIQRSVPPQDPGKIAGKPAMDGHAVQALREPTAAAQQSPAPGRLADGTASMIPARAGKGSSGTNPVAPAHPMPAHGPGPVVGPRVTAAQNLGEPAKPGLKEGSMAQLGVTVKSPQAVATPANGQGPLPVQAPWTPASVMGKAPVATMVGETSPPQAGPAPPVRPEHTGQHLHVHAGRLPPEPDNRPTQSTDAKPLGNTSWTVRADSGAGRAPMTTGADRVMRTVAPQRPGTAAVAPAGLAEVNPSFEASLSDPEIIDIRSTRNPVDGSLPNAILSRSTGPQALAIVRQLAPSIPLAVGDGAVEVSLEPAELGRVQMKLVQSEGVLALSVTAERPETLELMRRNADVLDRELLGLGFGGVDITFSHAGSDTHRDPDQPDTARPDSADLTQPAYTGAPLQALAQDLSGRVDLRI